MNKKYKIITVGEILQKNDIVCDGVETRNRYINQIEKYGMFKIDRSIATIFTNMHGKSLNIHSELFYLRLLVDFELINNKKCNIIKLKNKNHEN
jgi:hypothetical protein